MPFEISQVVTKDVIAYCDYHVAVVSNIVKSRLTECELLTKGLIYIVHYEKTNLYKGIDSQLALCMHLSKCSSLMETASEAFFRGGHL